jgi:hypothetical protein
LGLLFSGAPYEGVAKTLMSTKKTLVLQSNENKKLTSEEMTNHLARPAYKSPRSDFIGSLVIHLFRSIHHEMVREFKMVKEAATAISMDHTFRVG